MMSGKNKNKVNEPAASYGESLSFEKVWAMFQRIGELIQEDQKKIMKYWEKSEREWAEIRKKAEEDRERAEKDREKSEREWAEIRRLTRETDEKIKKLNDLFTTQWGRLVESLVEGDLLRVLKERGIQVKRTLQRVESDNPDQSYEFDIIALDGEHIVIVEVKTTLRTSDVRRFVYKLKQLRNWMPEYAGKKVLGAVAYLQTNADSHKMAQNQGLFAIKATGKSAHIINPEGFNPKVF